MNSLPTDLFVFSVSPLKMAQNNHWVSFLRTAQSRTLESIHVSTNSKTECIKHATFKFTQFVTS